MSGRNRAEDAIQRNVVRWLSTLDVQRRLAAVWFHVPNGGGRSPIEASIFKGLGVKAGVADLIFLWGDYAQVIERLVAAARAASALLNHIGADVPIVIPTLAEVAAELEAAIAGVVSVNGVLRFGGGAACMEIKAPAGRVSDSQRAFHAACERLHIRHVVAWSVADAMTAVEGWDLVRAFGELPPLPATERGRT